MKGLLFLARLAFICNILFLLCLIIQRTHDFIGNRELDSVVIILGWFMAPFLNLASNIWYFGWRISKKSMNFPAWLAVVNALFLFAQIYFHLILP